MQSPLFNIFCIPQNIMKSESPSDLNFIKYLELVLSKFKHKLLIKEVASP